MFAFPSDCRVKKPGVIEALRFDKGGIVTINTLCATTAAPAASADAVYGTADTALAVVVRVGCQCGQRVKQVWDF